MAHHERHTREEKKQAFKRGSFSERERKSLSRRETERERKEGRRR